MIYRHLTYLRQRERLKSKSNWLRTHFHHVKCTHLLEGASRCSAYQKRGTEFSHEDVCRQSLGFFLRACHAFPSPRICRYNTALLRWPTLPFIAPRLRELSLLLTVRTGSLTVGGSSSRTRWADSPTLFRSLFSTPADSKEEDLRGLFIEAGARQKVCMFSRARPGKDALEWSGVQLATALTLTPSARDNTFVEASIKMN